MEDPISVDLDAIGTSNECVLFEKYVKSAPQTDEGEEEHGRGDGTVPSKWDGTIRCSCCCHRCVIAPGKVGFCGVRYNRGGKQYLATWGKVTSCGVDPIEKKPLHHVRPGADILSLAPIGCNFRCSFCQNWELSQASLPFQRGTKPIEEFDSFVTKHCRAKRLSPDDVVQIMKREGCKALAFTYNEPGISFEYNYAIMRKVKAEIPNTITVYVSNGYETPEQWRLLAGIKLNATNIDLKAFTDEFYVKQCAAHLRPVMDSIKLAHDLGIWVEVTTLVIPGKNDSPDELRELSKFIASVDVNIPWHISAFHPAYKMTDVGRTPEITLQTAAAIGYKEGLKFIYLGNVRSSTGSNTICPSCRKTLVTREGYMTRVTGLDVKTGKCCNCGEVIPGIWH